MLTKRFHPGEQRTVLISCQSFRGINKDRTGHRIFQDFLHHRQIKAQGFTTGSRCSDHDIFSIHSMEKSFCLVGIESLYILSGQKIPDIRMQAFWKLCIFRRSGRDYFFVNDVSLHACSFAVNLLFGTKKRLISACSSLSSEIFLSIPPAYPVRLPFVPTTR